MKHLRYVLAQLRSLKYIVGNCLDTSLRHKHIGM